ncbi:hypothetical protein HK096_001445 [Nowakowskiella sp. JEL0078]|nr:hypothetical protein HK096_001445 [Nowakowskiella sp. JEL0078]
MSARSKSIVLSPDSSKSAPSSPQKLHTSITSSLNRSRSPLKSRGETSKSSNVISNALPDSSLNGKKQKSTWFSFIRSKDNEKERIEKGPITSSPKKDPTRKPFETKQSTTKLTKRIPPPPQPPAPLPPAHTNLIKRSLKIKGTSVAAEKPKTAPTNKVLNTSHKGENTTPKTSPKTARSSSSSVSPINHASYIPLPARSQLKLPARIFANEQTLRTTISTPSSKIPIFKFMNFVSTATSSTSAVTILTPEKPSTDNELKLQEGAVSSSSTINALETIKCDVKSDAVVVGSSETLCEAPVENQIHLHAHELDHGEDAETENGDSDLRHRDVVALVQGRTMLSSQFTERYKIEELLGEGAFGFVFAARRLIDNVEIAVKFMIKNKVPRHVWVEDESGRVPSEISILRTLNHPNIIKYIEHIMPDNEESGQYIILITELHGTEWDVVNNKALNPCRNVGLRTSPRSKPPIMKDGIKKRAPCDLFECIDAHDRIPDNTARFIFAQIALAVYYLNKKGFVHRDLKDENIVVDENYIVKIIDFGSAASIPQFEEKYFNYFNGTMHYASPEICNGEVYQGPEAEVWTLGILLFTIMFAENPFQDREEIIRGEYSCPRKINEDCENLINKMLEWDPDDRITIEEVIAHPWIAQEVAKLSI